LDRSVILKAIVLGLSWFFSKSSLQGAQTTIYCAVDESVGKVSGKYYKDCAEVSPYPQAENDVDAKRLWALSEKEVGLSTH